MWVRRRRKTIAAAAAVLVAGGVATAIAVQGDTIDVTLGGYEEVPSLSTPGSATFHAQIAVHVRVLSGRDPHHLVEAQFKAFARALREAAAIDPRETGVPSTKGSL